MIVNSDNYASNILNGLMDINIYKKIFEDIGIENYNTEDQYRKLSSTQIAKLFRILYNSTYLSYNNSEYALLLLSESGFKGGLVKEFPASVVVAHKFGEGGGVDETDLSDAGIVYLNNETYCIVVMTRGKNVTELSEIIGKISKKIYDYF